MLDAGFWRNVEGYVRVLPGPPVEDVRVCSQQTLKKQDDTKLTQEEMESACKSFSRGETNDRVAGFGLRKITRDQQCT